METLGKIILINGPSSAGKSTLAAAVHKKLELPFFRFSFDLFCVGVHCSLEELERRERARGNRRVGDARRDLEFVHKYMLYDFEIDAERPLKENAEALIAAWQCRSRPSAFEKMAVWPQN